MSDYFTSGQLAALSASAVRCDFLVRFNFAAEPAFVWNGNNPLLANDGNAYLPMYGMGDIDGLGMAGDTLSKTVTLSLTGLPNNDPDFLAIALADTPEVDQRTIVISLQLFNDDWSPFGMPIPLFHGFMQPPIVSRGEMAGVDGAVQTITIAAENIFYGRSLPPHGRNTDRDQQARSPGDKFFGFVSSIVSKTLRYPDF